MCKETGIRKPYSYPLQESLLACFGTFSFCYLGSIMYFQGISRLALKMAWTWRGEEIKDWCGEFLPVLVHLESA